MLTIWRCFRRSDHRSDLCLYLPQGLPSRNMKNVTGVTERGGILQDSEEIDVTSDQDEVEGLDFDLVTILTGKFRQVVENVPPEFASYSEEELIKASRPNEIDWQLRLNLWKKVKEARLQKRNLTATEVYDGILSKQKFHETFMCNPARVAFVTRPVIPHQELYESLNRRAISKLLEMVNNMPIEPKYVSQILRIAEAAGNRAYGPVIQKMQIQSRNLNVEMDAKQLPPVEGQEDLTKKIEAMQAKLLEQPREVSGHVEEEN